MIQTQIYRRKLAQGESVDIYQLDNNDTNFSYSIHTVITLGNFNDSHDVTINGIQMDLPGSFVFNHVPITNISVTTSTDGILIIGKKTRKTLF